MAAMDGQLHSTRPQIAILDFGSQYSHLIARRVRELNVFCELYSCLVKGEVIRGNNVVGVILSGGPNSVYEVRRSTGPDSQPQSLFCLLQYFITGGSTPRRCRRLGLH